MKLFQAIVVCTFISGCANTDKADLSIQAKQEIISAEEAFAKAVKEKGERIAFLEFADDSAVIKRGAQIFSGKKEIAECFDGQHFKNVSLEWKPDYVYASFSGDLGYTYGKFSFSGLDSEKGKIEVNGIFHTVWKKQSDGSWKYVFD